MTVTIFNFAPTNAAPFQFQPQLDGAIYNAIITWNVFGQRYYLNLYDLNNVRIVTIAVVGSPLGSDINLVGGYFTDKLVFREPNQQFEVISL